MVEVRKPVLAKPFGWALLTALLFMDAFLDVIRGVEGNPLWQYLVNIIGIKRVPFLVPVVLILFYFVVKICGWLIQKTDKTPSSEELVLTALVIIYGVYDVWVIAVDFFGFSLVTNYRLVIIPLTIIGLAYGLWAQKRLKTTFHSVC